MDALIKQVELVQLGYAVYGFGFRTETRVMYWVRFELENEDVRIVVIQGGNRCKIEELT